MRPRRVERRIRPEAVSDGAGVKIRRSIGTAALDHLDPFPLFDHFGSDDPDEYVAGFPMHPHRGIETVTYMLRGVVRHRDSTGRAGTIRAGDVQWMTAGGGILHEEMPEATADGLSGFQLWVNLPARLKMSSPRYQEVSADRIPEAAAPDGARVRVVAGRAGDVRGAVAEIAADPTYLDVTVPPGASFLQPVPAGQAAFAYVFEGEGIFGADRGADGPTGSAVEPVAASTLAVLGDGDAVTARAGKAGVRFLLAAGNPLREPIVRYGPFVMNTRAEIEQALRDLRSGTFVRG